MAFAAHMYILHVWVNICPGRRLYMLSSTITHPCHRQIKLFTYRPVPHLSIEPRCLAGVDAGLRRCIL